MLRSPSPEDDFNIFVTTLNLELLWDIAIKTHKTINVTVGRLLLGLKWFSAKSKAKNHWKKYQIYWNPSKVLFTSCMYGVCATRPTSLFYLCICSMYELWIDGWLINIDQWSETPLVWQHVTSSQQGISPVGTIMSYHAQDNYKLHSTGNFPALTCVLLLLEVGIHCEWNWANDNAKHCNPNYWMHKNFQTVANNFESCFFVLLLIIRIILWHL